MAEQAEGDNVFVYTGQQVVPDDITHVIIDRSVKIIPERAFSYRVHLVSVETHDGIEKVEQWAFKGCTSLRGIKLPGVREVGPWAFNYCLSLSDVEFGDKLDTIGGHAFFDCCSLQRVKMPSARFIGVWAFFGCEQLTDVELPTVERIGEYAFTRCEKLQRIAISLKDNTFSLDSNQRYSQFDECESLTTVDLVGVRRIRKTISSFLLESWRDEMNEEIDRINQVLPDTPSLEKADAIRRWITSVLRRMEYCKAEHNRLLKEATTLLELAVWKAKLDEVTVHSLEAQPAKKAKVDMENARKERRIVAGADINIIISM